LQDKHFSASEYYEKMCEGRRTDEAWRRNSAKTTVVAWWMSEETTRRPASIDKLGDAIGMKGSEIRLFVDSDEFARMFDASRLSNMRKMAFYIDKINMRRALEGRKESIAEFNKVFSDMKSKEKETGVHRDPSEMELEELRKSEEDAGVVDLTNFKLSKEEKMLEEEVIRRCGGNGSN